MNIKFMQRVQLLPIGLIGIMALTRFDHFGSAFSLPDASLAVFFFAGLGFSSLWFLAVLLFEAGIIDYVAITQFSVSDFCISSAYLFLIPAYAAMWLAGRYAKALTSLGFIDSIKAFGLAAIATTLAFVISNGSFYVLSDKFGELSWQQYLAQSAQYLPAYLSATLIYIVIGLAVVKLWKATQVLSTANS
jgi:hypothetical protein